MTRTWIALLDDPAPEAEHTALVDVVGHGMAVLARWTGKHHPHPKARAVDPRAVGFGGPVMSVSWLELEDDHRPLFDAPEVLAARRSLLRDWPAYGASTLVTDGTRLAGALVFRRSELSGQDNPFARLGVPQTLRTQGFFVPVPRPTGPALERYAGAPWPYDLFPDDPRTPRQESA